MYTHHTRSTSRFHPLAIEYIGHLFPCRQSHEPMQKATSPFSHITGWEKEGALCCIICWPANLFAVTSNLLDVTDAYKQTVCPPDPDRTWPPDLKKVFGARSKSWSPVFDWLSKTREEKHPQEDKHLQWRRLVKTCGKEWSRWLNEKAKFPRVAPAAGKMVQLTDREYSARLYKPLQRAWCELFELASGTCGEQDGARHESYIAARTICLFWNYVLGRLERPTDTQRKGRGQGVSELHTDWKLFVSLLSLHAIADEAALGWGTHKEEQFKDSPNCQSLRKLLDFLEALLDEHGTLALTPPELCRVLPKRHTPRVGMTLRNLSLNLAFHQSPVVVKWHQQSEGFRRDRRKRPRTLTSMSILLLPWPLRIDGKDFRPLQNTPREHGRVRGKRLEKYFAYDPDRCRSRAEASRRGIKLRDYVRHAIREAKREKGDVDMVILPELAVTRHELQRYVEPVLRRAKVLAYVAGVRDGIKKGFQVNAVYCRTWEPVKAGSCWPAYKKECPANIRAAFGPRKGGGGHEVQYKHHRWCLTGSQITQHQLGGILSPEHCWWEGIFLDRQRSVRFINLGGEITLCPLICEDLARQEPIGDLIRAVGPSIVVAILLDGPQIPDRWSARYASVLADDPGSAVVTLTSLGMVERCKSSRSHESRAIALWSDSAGPPRAIELDRDADAVLLSVAVASEREVSADGREDGIPTNKATLGGVHQIRRASRKHNGATQ